MNALDGYGRAAIHYAAERDTDCLTLLLANNSNINIRDSNQDTALHWACFKNNHECVKLLLQHGALVNAMDYNQDTPLSWAAMKGNLESIQILLDYNAKVDTTNLTGNTPVKRAAFILATGLDTTKDNVSLELLVKAAGQLNIHEANGQIPQWLTQDNKLSEQLLPFCGSPRKLKELCRFATRGFLGSRYLPNVIPQLPLPDQLQQYLLLHR